MIGNESEKQLMNADACEQTASTLGNSSGQYEANNALRLGVVRSGEFRIEIAADDNLLEAISSKASGFAMTRESATLADDEGSEYDGEFEQLTVAFYITKEVVDDIQTLKTSEEEVTVRVIYPCFEHEYVIDPEYDVVFEHESSNISSGTSVLRTRVMMHVASSTMFRPLK